MFVLVLNVARAPEPNIASLNSGRPKMSVDPRIAAASSFLLQSPPGEINDVLNGRYIPLNGDALLDLKFRRVESNRQTFAQLYQTMKFFKRV